MVSLLCHCCVDKPLVSLPIHRVFGCRFLVNPLTYRYYEKNSSKYSQLEGGFQAFKFSPLSMSGREKILFDTAFYMANYSDNSWEQANVPLHMYFPDDENPDVFCYKLGADFLTPFGEDKMFEFPSASEISSYLVPDLLFDSPTSDYFYFFVSCNLDFNKCNSELDFFDPHYYNSISPFFLVSGVPFFFTYSGVDFEHKLRLPYHSRFFDLCSRGFVYDFLDFYSIFQQGFLSAYSKFLMMFLIAIIIDLIFQFLDFQKRIIMPTYKITQQQGNRVITSTLEAKSVSDLIAFLTAVSTAEIKYIYKVEFESQKTHFPADDFNYNKQFKALISNKNRMCKQILLHNVKKTKNENELSTLIKTHLEVCGLAVKGVSCSLFMDK